MLAQCQKFACKTRKDGSKIGSGWWRESSRTGTGKGLQQYDVCRYQWEKPFDQ